MTKFQIEIKGEMICYIIYMKIIFLTFTKHILDQILLE